jgi:hypothetical protein
VPKLTPLLVEQVRTLAYFGKREDTHLRIQAGKEVCVESVIMDEVNSSVDIYLRMRAFLVSVAYVAIQNPGFFSYQAAYECSERILGFINATFNGRAAPPVFFAKAWAATVRKFAESLRTSGRTLGAISENVATWEHWWTMFQPSEARTQAPSGSSSRQAGFADPPPAVLDELERLKKTLRSMQSEKDRVTAELNKTKRDIGATNDRSAKWPKKDAGKGGKGKGGEKKKW